jgi:hypothetical protein
MGWLSKLAGNRPSFPHDAPDLEATLPTNVANQTLVTWSVSGDGFWDKLDSLGGGRLRSALSPELEDAGLSPDLIAMAVAGREDTRDPPYIVWAMRFGATRAGALPSPATALAMEVMHVDASQGGNWQDAIVADKAVLVGHHQMVHQDKGHRGKPYAYLGAWALYGLIADDEAWVAEVIRQLPAS